MSTIKKLRITISFISLLSILSIFTQAQAITDNIIKKNISLISNPLQSVLKLEPRIFEYETDKFKSFQFGEGKQYGFLAENMNEVFPAMVSSKSISYMYGKNSYRERKIQTIDEVSLIPVLVASIQELHNEIEQLKVEIKSLKK